MKKFTLKKKMIAGAAVAALALGVGGAAFAYWTATGAGFEHGHRCGSSNGTLVLHAPCRLTALTPGGSETVHVHGGQRSTRSSVAGGHGPPSSNLTTSDPLCLAADFGMSDVIVGPESFAASTSGVVISAHRHDVDG